MKTPPWTVVESWFNHHQNKWVIEYVVAGRCEGKFRIHDVINGITELEVFNSAIASKTWCYELHHDLLNAPETSFEIRQYLLKNETELALKLGRPDITKRQRDVLGLMLDITRDAITAEVWMK